MPVVPRAAFADEDWQVRWAAVRAEAAARTITLSRRASEWIETAPTQERAIACATAALGAGLFGKTLFSFLENEPSALKACQVIERSVLEECQTELLLVDQVRALEALSATSTAFERSHGRIVLDTLANRSAEATERLAQLLIEAATRSGTPAGRALLEAAKADDEKAMNRLLEVYATLRDRQRPLLSSTDRDARRQAVHALAAIAPLSAPELSSALADAEPSVRMAAARALARGEGRSIVEAALARFAPQGTTSASEKRRWLILLADVDDPACPGFTRSIWKDATQPDAVRADALVSLAGCARKESLADLDEASRLPNAVVQQGVMRAVLELPREPAVVGLVETALTSSTPEVLVAATTAIAAHRLAALSNRVQALVGHSDPTVRKSSLSALSSLDARKAQPVVITALAKDRDISVRATCAHLLADSGGPLAVSALVNTVKSDPNPHVKSAASASLRRLGIAP
jgi:HEAT repeat protein